MKFLLLIPQSNRLLAIFFYYLILVFICLWMVLNSVYSYAGFGDDKKQGLTLEEIHQKVESTKEPYRKWHVMVCSEQYFSKLFNAAMNASLDPMEKQHTYLSYLLMALRIHVREDTMPYYPYSWCLKQLSTKHDQRSIDYLKNMQFNKLLKRIEKFNFPGNEMAVFQGLKENIPKIKKQRSIPVEVSKKAPVLNFSFKTWKGNGFQLGESTVVEDTISFIYALARGELATHDFSRLLETTVIPCDFEQLMPDQRVNLYGLLEDLYLYGSIHPDTKRAIHPWLQSLNL